MANEQTELDSLAFEIFAKHVAQGRLRPGEQDAVASYRAAETFLAVRGRIQKGELKPSQKSDAPQLVEYAAPNLAKTSPFNLVSTRFGDLARCRKVAHWLKVNVAAPTDDPEAIAARFNAEHHGLNWTVADITAARVILSPYAPA